MHCNTGVLVSFLHVYAAAAILQLIIRIQTKRATVGGPLCAGALLGCISAVTWHAGCRGNMRISLVKWRSCRTGCSCTAETGICTVPWGAVRNTWETAPGETTTPGCFVVIWNNALNIMLVHTCHLFAVCSQSADRVSPVSWACAWDTCIAEVPWEKALSTASPPSVSAGVEAYITVWGLGYIMWPPTDVGTDEVTMVAGRLTVAGRWIGNRRKDVTQEESVVCTCWPAGGAQYTPKFYWDVWRCTGSVTGLWEHNKLCNLIKWDRNLQIFSVHEGFVKHDKCYCMYDSIMLYFFFTAILTYCVFKQILLNSHLWMCLGSMNLIKENSTYRWSLLRCGRSRGCCRWRGTGCWGGPG